MKRKDDTHNLHAARSRSSRVYEEGNYWYFNTREGTVVGPFRDDLEAYTQLEVYIRLADSGMLRPGEAFNVRKLKVESAG